MKKFNLLVAGLLMLIIAKANGNYVASELNLTLWDNSMFNVVIDHQNYNATNNLYLADLTPGVHWLEVVKTKKNRYGNGGFKQVLYKGKINIPKNTAVKATITPNRQLTLVMNKKKNHGHGKGYGHHQSQHQHQHGIGCNEFYGCFSPITVMGEYEFNQLLGMLDNTSFDSEKLAVLKQVVNTNYLNTEYVTILANRLTFDSNKLTFAKWAYAKTVDKQNYFLVSNVFTFNSSITTLNNYINQMG